MADKLSLPGPYGGIVRYDEEYKSRFNISPTSVVVFLVIIALFAIGLKLFGKPILA